MRVIAKTRLFDLASKYGDCTKQIERWYTAASKASWGNLVDVRQSFRRADAVDDKTIFNIKANNYRLIVKIN